MTRKIISSRIRVTLYNYKREKRCRRRLILASSYRKKGTKWRKETVNILILKRKNEIKKELAKGI